MCRLRTCGGGAEAASEDGRGSVGATAVLAAAQRPDIVVVDARSNANLDVAASVARWVTPLMR